MFIARCHHNLRLTAIWSQDDVDSETKKNMPCQLSEYATIAPASLLPEFSSMTLRALLYRRPTEPQAIEVVCDGAIHLVRLRRHRQARRYTLRVVAVTREAVLTMPPRGSVHAIVHRRGARGTVWTESDRDGGRHLCVAGGSEHVTRRITDHLKR